MGRFHSNQMRNLIELGPYGKNGEIQMVVETPRGSNIKLHYEPKLGAFTVSRALPLGLIYPYDWGFVPGTKGEDGDPIDALALHDGATYPGVVLPCHALGVVELVQEEKNKARCKIRASSLCQSGTIAWANWRGLQTCPLGSKKK